MTIRIDRIRSATPELEAFIAAHLRDLESTAPTESRHARGTSRLLAADARLFAAFADDTLVGAGALVTVEPDHEELKSMRTAPSTRGRGTIDCCSECNCLHLLARTTGISQALML